MKTTSASVTHFVCYHWGELYGPENIERLYRSVTAQFSFPFEFHCLSAEKLNLRSEIHLHVLPFGQPFKGNWNKLRTFSEGFLNLPTGETVIVFDLDLLITGNLDFLVLDEPDANMVFARDKHKSRVGKVQTSTYRIKVGCQTNFWDDILKEDPIELRKQIGKESDQSWIDRYLPKDAPTFYDHDKIVSFKYDCSAKGSAPLGNYMARQGATSALWKKAKLPNNARIVMFHGKPDMDEVANTRWGRWCWADFIDQYQY